MITLLVCFVLIVFACVRFICGCCNLCVLDVWFLLITVFLFGIWWVGWLYPFMVWFAYCVRLDVLGLLFRVFWLVWLFVWNFLLFWCTCLILVVCFDVIVVLFFVLFIVGCFSAWVVCVGYLVLWLFTLGGCLWLICFRLLDIVVWLLGYVLFVVTVTLFEFWFVLLW